LNPGVDKDGTAEPVQPTKSATLANKTFADMAELHPTLLEALSKGFEFQHPSAIQALLLPKFLNSSAPKDTLVASETGSGKTLAYLLPLFHSLKTQEDALAKEAETSTEAIHQTLDAVMANGQLVSSLTGLAQVRKLGRPRAVILVPSRELVAQVTEVAKTLSHYCKLRVFGMHSRTRPSHVKAALSSAPVDILVSTPGALQEHLKDSTIAFSQCRHIVLDEADTLLDRGFAPEIQKMVHGARESAKVNKHSFNALFVSATLPKTLVRLLNKDFPDLDTLTTPGLHHAIARVHQSFLKIDSSTTKQNLLLEVLKLDVVKSPRILIFRNTRKGCELLTSFLKSRQYDAQMVTSETRAEDRAEIWSSFKAFGNVEKEGCKILVATDLASRGMDTTSCRHVILYDFPQTTIDYLHRAGRVGRMGRKGRVTSFVGKKDRRLADSIELAIRRRQFLSQ
jgi:superfamily II DNA/RNA helicase